MINVAMEIGIMEVAGFTIAAIIMGLGVGYFFFIAPAKRAAKAEEEYQARPREEQKEAPQVPMSDIPAPLTADVNEALKEQDGV